MFLGVITARGGSKGIPGKNIAPCAGRPLLAYTCDAALASRGLDRVILSTDGEPIADVARAFGVEVPFMRPTALATDTAPTIAVLQHVLAWADNVQLNVTALVVLQPTSPLRKSAHIDGAIKLFKAMKADSVVSVVEVPHQFHPSSVMEMDGQLQLRGYGGGDFSITRRQELKKIYARNGPAVLVTSAACVREGKLYGAHTYGYLMSASPTESLDIDTPEDLRLAQILLAHPDSSLDQ